MKSAVDDAIDQCSTVYNLRNSIEEARLKAEEATDEKQKRIHTSKGWFVCIRRCDDFNTDSL